MKRKKELPIEYTPVTLNEISIGDKFGPIKFSISEKTDKKTKSYLENSDLQGQTKLNFNFLMPSDMWGLARLFSQKYGRANETLLAKSFWEIRGYSFPKEDLFTEFEIKNTFEVDGLPFMVAETLTKNVNGKILLKSIDQILLLHNVNKKFYIEKNEQLAILDNPDYFCEREVYFRHKWNENKWKNNIHTKDYAQKFGFKEEIPEFINYMDWIFLASNEKMDENSYNKSINLKGLLPMYKKDVLLITSKKIGNVRLVRGSLKNNLSGRFTAFVK